jgi:hypothetical protein
MATSLNEIGHRIAEAGHEAASDIANYPIDWGAVFVWIGIIWAGFWLFGKVSSFLDERKKKNLESPIGDQETPRL